MPMFLSTSTDTSVSSALAEGLQTVANDAVGAIQDIIPVAVVILGAFFVVSVGIKAFKKISGR